jgi:hypothetical protein
MIDKPGIISGLPMSEYLADPCPVPSLSSGCACTLLQQSPFHAWACHPRNPKPLPRDGSRVASIGTVAHALLLENCEDSVAVLDPQDYIGKRGGVPKGFTNDAIRDARDAAIADGKTPLLIEDMQSCRAMRDAALEYVARSEIASAFKSGEAEATAIAQEGAVWLRCRPDWITHDKSVVVHLKTTARSARPESFIRGLLPSMGYDIALGFYARVIAAASGIVPDVHCILVQEQEPPYACSLIGLSPAYVDIVDRQVEQAISTWRECMRTNHWPAYPTRIAYAEPKPWQIADAEEQEIRNFMPDPLQERHGVQA